MFPSTGPEASHSKNLWQVLINCKGALYSCRATRSRLHSASGALQSAASMSPGIFSDSQALAGASKLLATSDQASQGCPRSPDKVVSILFEEAHEWQAAKQLTPMHDSIIVQVECPSNPEFDKLSQHAACLDNCQPVNIKSYRCL